MTMTFDKFIAKHRRGLNAKDELIKVVYKSHEIGNIIAADIELRCSRGQLLRRFVLPINYTEETYNDFLSSLNFNYDNGLGSQYLYGIVWFKDGTWLKREEYDGAEWWKHCKCPKMKSDVAGLSDANANDNYDYDDYDDSDDSD